MTTTGAFLKENRRWLGALSLLTFTSSFGQTFFISIFSGAIRQDFDLTHGAWAGIYGAATFASAVVMIWAGALTDRFRVTALSRVILPLLALACLGMAIAPAAWVLLPLVFLLRFAGQGMTSHIAVVAAARWFVATRGRALSVAAMGFAVGEALLPVIFVALLAIIHWQVLWLIAGTLVLAILPVITRLLAQERTPSAEANVTTARGMQDRDWTRRDVLKHWLFWLLIPQLLGPAAFGTAFFFHQVHFAAEKGLTHLSLVAIFPVYTATAILVMIGSGFLIDKIGTARMMPLFQLPMVLAFGVLSLDLGLTGAVIGMALMALTVGANHTLPGAFWAEFYGTRHLGAVKAMASAIMVLGTAIGPVVTGWGIDRGLSFDAQMIWIAIYFALASGLAAIGIGKAAPTLSKIDSYPPRVR